MKNEQLVVGSLPSLCPTVNFANQLASQPGQIWGPRIIPDCQLLYIISGKATLELGGQHYHAIAGDCLFYGKNSPHCIRSSSIDPVQFYSIHFSWNQNSSFPTFPFSQMVTCTEAELKQLPLTYIVSLETYETISIPHHFSALHVEDLFSEITAEFDQQTDGYTLKMRGVLMQLLVSIVRQQMKRTISSAAKQKISTALEAIHNKPQLDWKTADLAKLCGYHPTYFAALFKEATGYNPKRYLMLKRIRKAKALLLELHSIEDVALQLGYSSFHYFCRSFKQSTGLTPSEYKKLRVQL